MSISTQNIEEEITSTPEIEEFENGKWISINVSPDIYYWTMEIKKSLAGMSIRVSRNDIMNRLLLFGTENLSFDLVMKNPLVLWSNQAEEELG
jgi:hypothetical protein